MLLLCAVTRRLAMRWHRRLIVEWECRIRNKKKKKKTAGFRLLLQSSFRLWVCASGWWVQGGWLMFAVLCCGRKKKKKHRTDPKCPTVSQVLGQYFNPNSQILVMFPENLPSPNFALPEFGTPLHGCCTTCWPEFGPTPFCSAIDIEHHWFFSPHIASLSFGAALRLSSLFHTYRSCPSELFSLAICLSFVRKLICEFVSKLSAQSTRLLFAELRLVKCFTTVLFRWKDPTMRSEPSSSFITKNSSVESWGTFKYRNFPALQNFKLD